MGELELGGGRRGDVIRVRGLGVGNQRGCVYVDVG